VTPQTLNAVPGVNSPQPTTYAEFWPYYVSQHLHPMTRALHAWGPLLALTIAVTGVVTGRLLLLPAALVVGYGIAWISHFAIERNKPASWGPTGLVLPRRHAAHRAVLHRRLCPTTSPKSGARWRCATTRSCSPTWPDAPARRSRRRRATAAAGDAGPLSDVPGERGRAARRRLRAPEP
jgi:hypothetical protein